MLVIDSDKSAAEHREQYRSRLRLPSGAPISACLHRSVAYCNRPYLIPAPSIFKTIPRADWIPMIRDGAGHFLHDRTKNVLPPHDQGSTNYCWAHGTVRGLEVLRVYEGQRPLVLSAESVAVPLTNGRNRGGYADEAVKQLCDFGACEQRYWPANDRDANNADKAWLENRDLYRVLKWLDVVGWDVQMTLALRRIPCPIGLGWWEHLVCGLDPVELDSKTVGLGFDNSWGGDYGDNGYAVLDEKHGTADLGAIAPLSASFSLN